MKFGSGLTDLAPSWVRGKSPTARALGTLALIPFYVLFY